MLLARFSLPRNIFMVFLVSVPLALVSSLAIVVENISVFVLQFPSPIFYFSHYLIPRISRVFRFVVASLVSIGLLIAIVLALSDASCLDADSSSECLYPWTHNVSSLLITFAILLCFMASDALPNNLVASLLCSLVPLWFLEYTLEHFFTAHQEIVATLISPVVLLYVGSHVVANSAMSSMRLSLNLKTQSISHSLSNNGLFRVDTKLY